MHDALRIIDANFNRSREALRVMEEYARFCLNDATLTERCKTLRHDLTNVLCGLQLKIETGGVVPVDRASAQAKACGSGETGTEQGKARGSGETGSVQALDGAGFHLACGEGERPGGKSGEAQGVLIAARDTNGDVGTKIANDGEYNRSDTLHVALAATKRLTEALRAIEEYGKIIDPAFARRIEQLRYSAYDVERGLALTARARRRFADVRLYVLITEALCKTDWFETARITLDNGADCIQLREKYLTDAELLDRATRLARLCREMDKLLIINDRPDIAAASGAHGIHLGQGDIDVRSARRILPPGSIVGLSTHTTQQIESAIVDTPDYIAVGPMFESGTKPQDHVTGCDTLVAANEKTALPLVAIGGLDPPRSGEVIARAPCCICVCSFIISQTDVVTATRNIRSAIDDAWQLRQDG